MLKAILVIGIVLLVIIGGLITLRGSARTGMPDAATLDRAGKRARDMQAQDKDGDG
jgi:hypothetical protein